MSNTMNRKRYSFQYKVKEKILNILIELKEINQLPNHQRTGFALQRKDRLEKDLKWYLFPTNALIDNSINDKQVVDYLISHPEVITYILENGTGIKRIGVVLREGEQRIKLIKDKNAQD